MLVILFGSRLFSAGMRRAHMGEICEQRRRGGYPICETLPFESSLAMAMWQVLGSTSWLQVLAWSLSVRLSETVSHMNWWAAVSAVDRQNVCDPRHLWQPPALPRLQVCCFPESHSHINTLQNKCRRLHHPLRHKLAA